MSFGLSPSDIIDGIQTCKWLYDHCFNISAHERYLEFGQDIKTLKHALEDLRKRLESRINDYRDCAEGRESLQKRCADIVGDFNGTLAECKKVLRGNRNLQWSSGVVQNIYWGASLQNRVDELRDRLLFHLRKIDLVIQAIHTDTLFQLQQNVANVLRILVNPDDGLFPIPEVSPALASRFESRVREAAPAAFRELESINLKDGLAAFSHHFKRSTCAAIRPEDVTPEQLLNLVKCSWLLSVLMERASSRNDDHGSQIVLELTEKVRNEYRRGKWKDKEQDLLNLEDQCFDIWIPSSTPPVAQNGIVGLHEERLDISIELPVEKDFSSNRLYFYRASPRVLNVVRERVRRESSFPYSVSGRVNIRHDILVPWYVSSSTKPTSSSNEFGLEVRSGNETGNWLYDFHSLSDAWKFQRVLTGYEVVHEWTDVSWCLDQRWSPLKGFFKRGMSEGEARLQLWRWNPVPHAENEVAQRSSNSLSDNDGGTSFSRASIASNATIQKAIRGCDPSLFHIIQDTGSLNGERWSATIAANKPPPPALVMFTTFKGRWTILHMEVNGNHRVAVESREEEAESVVEVKASEIFKIRRLSADFERNGNPNTDQWNLLVFSRPFSDETIPHAAFLSLPKLTSRYLSLVFKETEERQAFDKEFSHLVSERVGTLAKLQELSQNIQMASDHVVESKTSTRRHASQVSTGPLQALHKAATLPANCSSAYCMDPTSSSLVRAGTV